MSYLIPPRRTDKADVDAFVAGVKRVKEKHEAESAANHMLQLADAEITALTAKLEAAREDVARVSVERDKAWTDACNLLDTITEQAAKIESLEKDAARYRWLKENKARNNTHCWHFQQGSLIPGLQTLDAAIDAAILGDSHV